MRSKAGLTYCMIPLSSVTTMMSAALETSALKRRSDWRSSSSTDFASGGGPAEQLDHEEGADQAEGGDPVHERFVDEGRGQMEGDGQLAEPHGDGGPHQAGPRGLRSEVLDGGGGAEEKADGQDRAPPRAVGDDGDHRHGGGDVGARDATGRGLCPQGGGQRRWRPRRRPRQPDVEPVRLGGDEVAPPEETEEGGDRRIGQEGAVQGVGPHAVQEGSRWTAWSPLGAPGPCAISAGRRPGLTGRCPAQQPRGAA